MILFAKSCCTACPTILKRVCFRLCGASIAHIKSQNRYCACFLTKNERVLQGPGEGAGIIDIGDNQAVVFKAESHNHPSAVEPYEGAATGVGGILRDIFSMGARPIASLDSLHFGEIDRPRTKYLINEVVAGIGGYGNCMGIPTIAGEMTFDECYTGNCLVNAMSVGLMDQADMQKGRASGIGNAVIYVGAKPDVTASMVQRLLLLILTMKKKLSVQQFRSAIRLWKSF